MKKFSRFIFAIFSYVCFSDIYSYAAESLTLSDYFTYKSKGDFSCKKIVLGEPVFQSQTTLGSILHKLESEIAHIDELFVKLDFSNSHVTFKSFETIMRFLLEHAENFEDLNFLNFSSNPSLLVSEDQSIDTIFQVLQRFPKAVMDFSNTKIDNIQRLKEISNTRLIWISEDLFEWTHTSEEVNHFDIKENYLSLIGELNSPDILHCHKDYFQSRKLGGEYWKGTLFENFNDEIPIIKIGDKNKIMDEIRSDLTIKEEFFKDYLEGLDRNDVCSFYKIAVEYLEQRRLKYNPLKSFLMAKYIKDNNVCQHIDEIYANASWLLSTFYRDGCVVMRNLDKANIILTDEITKKSPLALSDLENHSPESIPDNITESCISSSSLVLSREILERDYGVFDPGVENIWTDVYDSKISHTLAEHVNRAQVGIPYSAFVVGRYYISGRNLKKDIAKAYKWLRYAVDSAKRKQDTQKYVNDAKKRIEKIESLAKD